MPLWAWITLTAVAALTAGGCFYGFLSMATTPHHGSTSTAAEADISNCSHAGSTYRGNLRVKNTGTKTATIVVDIEWTDPGGTRVASTVAIVNDLAPGQSAVKEPVATGPSLNTALSCSANVR